MTFGSRSAAAAACLALTLMASLIAVRVYTAYVSDGNVAAREEALIANGLRGWVSEVEGKVSGQTTWDDAALNLGKSYDPAWAHENIGIFLHQASGFEQAYVLDAGNQPIYAMANGRDQPPARYAVDRSAVAELVTQVRAAEGRRPATSTQGSAKTMQPPIQASAFARIAGQPSIATATLVQSDFGKVVLRGRAPIVVTVEALDADLLARFSTRFLLQNLRVIPADGSPSLGATVDLRWTDGARIGRLEWTPQRPGHKLLMRTMPGLIAVMLMFCAVTTAIFLRGRNAAQALIASEFQAKHMAYHDHLTGLANRAMFSERIAQALADMRRDARTVGVLALDLDRFKLINDTYGHGAGDALIVEIAGRLKALARTGDVVARLGGDEFAVLQVNASPHGLAALADRVVKTLSRPIDLPFGRVFPSVSVGVTLVSETHIDGQEALRQADLAMYRAKDAGRGRYHFFEPDMDLALKSRRALEQDLREALAGDAITMVYQPQVDGHGEVVGVEALARWDHPVRGPVSPAFFVSIAEECGLIEALGEFTLRRAFSDSLRWPTLKVAVNVSASQIRGGGFADMAAAILAETGADPRRIELEITESVLLEDDEVTHDTLNRLRGLGFSLALDDFGTGYSSLAYLRRYPVDKIKIDRSFITGLGVEQESEAVVSAIVKLARALKLEVIAEGVETDAQRRGLRRAGCSHIQGFLYSRPVDVDSIGPLLVTADGTGVRRLVAA